MTKDGFVEFLKRAGFAASIEDGIVTVSLVDASKAEVSKCFGQIKLSANKVGYKHSFRVVSLKEDKENG